MNCEVCQKLFEENELCCAHCFNMENIPECSDCKILIRKILRTRLDPCPNFQKRSKTIEQKTFTAKRRFIFDINDEKILSENNSLEFSCLATKLTANNNPQETIWSFSNFESIKSLEPITTMSYNSENGISSNSSATADTENRIYYDSETDTDASDNQN